MDFLTRYRCQLHDFLMVGTAIRDGALHSAFDFLRGADGVIHLHFLFVQNKVVPQLHFSDMFVGGKLLG